MILSTLHVIQFDFNVCVTLTVLTLVQHFAIVILLKTKQMIYHTL